MTISKNKEILENWNQLKKERFIPEVVKRENEEKSNLSPVMVFWPLVMGFIISLVLIIVMLGEFPK